MSASGQKRTPSGTHAERMEQEALGMAAAPRDSEDEEYGAGPSPSGAVCFAQRQTVGSSRGTTSI